MKQARQIIKEYNTAKKRRVNFDSLWQECHDYFDNIGLNVTNFTAPGTAPNIAKLYDSNSLDSSDTLAAGLTNHLTPPSSRWFNFRTTDVLKGDDTEIMLYLKEIEAGVIHALNDSNFYDVIVEFYKKSGVYGTSVLYIEEDDQDGVRFYSLDVNSCVLVENSKGRVESYYIDFKYTAAQAVDKFDEENVHANIRKAYKEGDDKEYDFILHVEPNHHRDIRSKDSKDKPYLAQWVDKTHIVNVMDSGYDESPLMAHRFYKQSNSAWGYSPAMKAMLDVKQANKQAYTLLKTQMFETAPSVAVPENAFLFPLNNNPNAVNIYKRGSLSKDDIIRMPGGGSVNTGREALDYSVSRVKSLMFTDVFLAFDGVTKQMNNPEVYERIAEKMTMLGPAVGRFMSEILDPLLHRVVSLLFRQGKFSDPPEALLGNPTYEIEYVSRLAQAQKNGELQALQSALTMTANHAQLDPSVLDKIKGDESVDVYFGVTGAPAQLIRDADEVAAFRQQRAEAQASAQRTEDLHNSADLALKASQIEKTTREAAA